VTRSIAIVIPIHDEEEILPVLFARLMAVFDTLDGVVPQVILVDDGSRDRSLELLTAQSQADPRFSVVELSRNFGHQAAIAAGLEEAERFEAAIVMDGDLQDPPEVIGDLIAAWREGGEVVMARRRSRQDRGLRGLGMRLFHRVFGWIADDDMPADVGVFGLLDRCAVAELNRLSEHHRFLPGLNSWIGFERRVVFYDRDRRAGGEPSQSLTRLVRYALDGIFSFSFKPLRIMTAIGVVISVIGGMLATYFIGKRLLGIEQAPMGFTTLVSLLLFVGGVQLMGIGLLGEYLGRVYTEVKRRPLFIVRKRFNLPDDGGVERRQP